MTAAISRRRGLAAALPHSATPCLLGLSGGDRSPEQRADSPDEAGQFAGDGRDGLVHSDPAGEMTVACGAEPLPRRSSLATAGGTRPLRARRPLLTFGR